MTRLELENLVADWLNDPNKTFYTAAKIQTRLNLAQKVLQFKIIGAYQDFYTICATSTTDVDKERYKLPTDFLKMRKVEIITSGSGDTAIKRKLETMDLNQTELITPVSGDPLYYFLTKNHMHLRKVPTSAQSMEIHYIYRVADMASDSSEPDAPSEFHEYIAILAVEDNMIKDANDVSALLRKKEAYEEDIKKMTANRKPDGARMITQTRDGY